MNKNKSIDFVQIKNIFESISNEYDFMNDLMTLRNHSKWKKEIAEIAIASSPKRILDIATGTGDIAINLSKINGSKIDGVDISDNMLKVARKKIKELKINNINFKTCEAENLVFEDNHFDIISIGYGVRNFSNLEKGLNESYRVLKKDGKLIILETSVPENPIIKFLYKLITRVYIPIIAFIFSGKTKAYLYLLDSTDKFPPKNKFVEILYKTGFEKIETRKKLYGASTQALTFIPASIIVQSSGPLRTSMPSLSFSFINSSTRGLVSSLILISFFIDFSLFWLRNYLFQYLTFSLIIFLF